MKTLQSIPQPTLGTDPEAFLMRRSNGEVVAADSVVPAKSGIPESFYFDNIAVEFSVNPSKSATEIVESHRRVMTKLLEAMNQKELDLDLAPAREIPMETLESSPIAMEFGCEPSFVVGTEKQIKLAGCDRDAAQLTKRSIGFHVHLGSSESGTKALLKQDFQIRLVQACDIMVGLPAVLIDRDERNLWRRKEVGYGTAGEFRPQPYGFEYRTLSPWPLKHPMWTSIACRAVRDAYNAVSWNLPFLKEVPICEVQAAINENDFRKAKGIWDSLKVELRKVEEALPSTKERDSSVMFNGSCLNFIDAVSDMGGVDNITLAHPQLSLATRWQEDSVWQNLAAKRVLEAH